MGRGDKKSKKGKIAKGSFGNSRRKRAIKAKLKRTSSKRPAAPAAVETTEAVAKPKRTITKKKAEA